ncbi:Acetylornithine aminotransferase [Hyphomicrobium sulfonivorans]|uniref:Acetylornithine aminotransferase n=1 Tax=Hyphomicrobium sulfonivorans TaxID=121290 RepID=A0A120CXG1_HYPSL|nr:aspartate aminotransferase family protein [Hyphomicrobium sulfonivorans]KWT70900.1 Acetylornithine aminotransferase [Hyphomicrobium sulfonivorans]
MGTYARQNLVFERGEGVWLITVDGDRYLDLGSGVAVNVLGHAHPRLVAALNEQASKLWHTSNLYRVEGQERLAERLVATTFADKVFFCNSGAEACEAAIKAARRYHFAGGEPERWRIITFNGAFHGRTLATIAAGGNPRYLEGFGTPVAGFDQVPFGDLTATEKAISPETAAIMIEPVQGEGGVNVASAEFMQGLRALCDANGLLLVLDEVQSGIGRSGQLFSYELAGITPDLMAIAKGIGGGFPLGALLATENAARGLVPGTHGSTFGGNPLATAIGLEVLNAVQEEGFLESVRRKSLHIKQSLAAISDNYPGIVQEVRGQGLLVGLKLSVPPADLVAAAREEHLLLVGASDNVVRLLPPLNITDEEIAEAMQRLERALDRVAAART